MLLAFKVLGKLLGGFQFSFEHYRHKIQFFQLDAFEPYLPSVRTQGLFILKFLENLQNSLHRLWKVSIHYRH
jgi:hypothetical protein